MTRRLRAIVLLAALAPAALLVSPRPLAAAYSADADVAITGVRVGFSGHYKVGHWAPVEVEVENRGAEPVAGRVTLTLPDGDGTPSRVESREPVEIAPRSKLPVRFYAKFGRLESTLAFRFVHAEGAVLAERDLQAGRGEAPFFVPKALAATDELYVSLGPSLGVGELAVIARRRERSDVHVVELPDLTGLPDQWFGYEAVDAVWLSTSDPKLLNVWTPQAAEAEALGAWVQMGGRLIVSAGPQAEEVLQPESWLAQLAPARFDRWLPLRRATPLEAYADTQTPLETKGRVFRLDVPRFADVRGKIEAYEGNRATDLPLVIRAPHGFGEVVLVAIALDQPPVAAWPGRTGVIQRLLGQATDGKRIEASEEVGAVTTIGYADLSGQLRAALEQFDGVAVVSFAVVGGLIFVYLLLIGPFDYWLVKKVFGRMETTWITFTSMVVLISAGAYFAAYALKGRELRTNEVEIIDFDLESKLARGTVWANLFSPEPATYNLALATQLPGKLRAEAPPATLFSWLGLPGKALGGMQSGTSNPPLFNQPYDFTPKLDAVRHAPVQIWSTKGFIARWRGQVDVPLKCELTAGVDGMLQGGLVNQLGIELHDARLHFDRWVYPLPTLKDGQSVTIGDRLQPLTSRTLLTRQRVVTEKKDLRDITTSYDVQSSDVARILEMMMFHRLAGGERYTVGLSNRYQGYTDLTGHLTLGRAVLVARAEEPTSTLTRDGQKLAGENDRRWTYYRFVIPVAPAAKP